MFGEGLFKTRVNAIIIMRKRTGTSITIFFCLLELTPGFGVKSLVFICSRVCSQGGGCFVVFVAVSASGFLVDGAFADDLEPVGFGGGCTGC